MTVIVFEHQSTSLKATTPEKLLRYISAIWDTEQKEGKKFLSAPYFIVLRTGRKPHRGKYPTMADLLPKGNDGKPVGNVVEVEYDVIDLPGWSFDELIGGAKLKSALRVLHTMTGDSLDDFPAALLPLLEISDEEQKVELTKELLDFVDKALKARNRRLDEAMIHKALQPIFSEKEQTMIKSIFDEQQEIGEARGKAESGRNMVLTALRTKFRRMPKNIEKVVSAMSDPIALESLLVQAIQCVIRRTNSPKFCNDCCSNGYCDSYVGSKFPLFFLS